MKKTSNAIRFETKVPLREVMIRDPVSLGIEANVAKAAKTMCRQGVGSVIILEHNKPIGIVTVSAGGFGGLTCLAQLRLVTLGMGAFPIPESLAISRVHDSFNDDGTPNDPAYEKRAAAFLDEVLWFAEAIADRKAKETRAS